MYSMGSGSGRRGIMGGKEKWGEEKYGEGYWENECE